MKHSHINWAHAAADLGQRGEGYVLITVLEIRGSAPRGSGTKMLVSAAEQVDTIGGGHLEYLAVQQARTLLHSQNVQPQIEEFPLGAKLGQCCGGSVKLLFECFPSAKVTIALFGAGHVGQALAPLLAKLPVQCLWIDNRADAFPDPVPTGLHRCLEEYPADRVAQLPAGTFVVVMTHQHPLDYAIVENAIRRDDLHFIGLIGSATKARRFQKRLQHRGYEPNQIARMICPVGHADVTGKHPMEIAVAIAAQLIQLYQPLTNPRPQPTQKLGQSPSTALLGHSRQEEAP